MKKVFLLLLFVFLAQAASASVELARNHCSPVGCEQVYKVITASPASIQDGPNFKIELEEAIGSYSSLEYYVGLETFTPKNMEVYGTQCETIKDKNGMEYEGNCHAFLDYIKAENSKSIDWQKGFYGKQLQAGKTYYIKAVMEKEPAQKFEGDLVMTFAGTKYKEFAWWSSSWDYKQKITMQTDSIGLSGDVTQDHVVLVDLNSANSAFWSHVLSSGNDVRFTNAAETTEYPYYFQKWDYAGSSALAWVLVSDTFSASSNTEFYMYYGNAGAGVGAQPISALTNYLAVYHADTASTTDLDVNSANYDFNMTASSAAIWDQAIQERGLSSLNINSANVATQATLLDTMPANLTLTWWFRPNTTLDNGLGTNPYIFEKVNTPAANRNWAEFYFGAGTGLLNFDIRRENTNYSYATSQNSWTQDVWYHMIFTWNTTDGAVTYINGSVDGSNAAATTPMSNGSNTDFCVGENCAGSAKFPGWIDEITVSSMAISPSDANLMYHIETDSILTIGAEEIPVTPDVNVSDIEGIALGGPYPFFSYQGDLNLTIDFNVYMSSNARISIDINYDIVKGQGTGTPIYEDLNLNSEFCADLDWSDVPSECSLDFNIIGIGDNNFYIKILASSGGNTDFNESVNSFAIDNNAPTLSAYYPVSDQGTSSPSVSFVIELDDYSFPHQAIGGFFWNNSLDYNESKDVNVGKAALFTYNTLFGYNDTVYFVLNSASDIAGNSGPLVQKTGTYTRNVLTPVSQENVTQENVEKGTQAMLYNIFITLGTYGAFFVLFMFAAFVVFGMLKTMTGG